ncbi:MAG: hypothetical protein ACOYL8_00970 [Patescibacteria group bacterium]
MENMIALKELRLNIEKYANEVKNGKSFIVLKQSKPIFKLSPVEDGGDERWDEVINFTKIKKGGVDIDSLLKAL